MLSILNPTLHKTQRLLHLLDITKDIKDKALFIQENCVNNTYTIPIFPVLNLWGIWNNVILFSTFSDYIFIKNLRTKHKKIFYIHDLNWNVDSINMDNTIHAIENSDVVFCRSESDLAKLKEFTDKDILLFSNKIFEESLYELIKENS